MPSVKRSNISPSGTIIRPVTYHDISSIIITPTLAVVESPLTIIKRVNFFESLFVYVFFIVFKFYECDCINVFSFVNDIIALCVLFYKMFFNFLLSIVIYFLRNSCLVVFPILKELEIMHSSKCIPYDISPKSIHSLPISENITPKSIHSLPILDESKCIPDVLPILDESKCISVVLPILNKIKPSLVSLSFENKTPSLVLFSSKPNQSDSDGFKPKSKSDSSESDAVLPINNDLDNLNLPIVFPNNNDSEDSNPDDNLFISRVRGRAAVQPTVHHALCNIDNHSTSRMRSLKPSACVNEIGASNELIDALPCTNCYTNKNKHESRSLCCSNGMVKLPPKECPIEFLNLLSNEETGLYIRDNSIELNRIMALGSNTMIQCIHSLRSLKYQLYLDPIDEQNRMRE